MLLSFSPKQGRDAAFALTLIAAGMLVPKYVAAEVVPITVDRPEPDDTSIGGTDTFRVALQESHSYECSLSQKLLSVNSPYITFDLQATNPSGQSVTLTGVGNIEPVVTPPAGKSSLKARISLFAGATGTYVLRPDLAANEADFATARCYDTTLFGEFNTFYAQVPILELVNRTSHELTAFVQAIDYAGHSLFEHPVEISVNASTRRDLVLSSIPLNTYGIVRVAFIGPQGAFAGTMSEYNYEGATPVLRRERALRGTAPLP